MNRFKFGRISWTVCLSATLMLFPGGLRASQANKAPAASARAHTQSSASSSENLSLTNNAENEGKTNLREGTKISTQLESSLDANTAKPGDQVAARVTHNVKQNGQVVIHKGAHLLGHVTTAQAAANARSSSQLAVAFDQVVDGGVTSQLNTVVSSVISTPAQERMQQQQKMEPMMPMEAPLGAPGNSTTAARAAGGGGGLIGGVGSTVNSAASTAANVTGDLSSTTRATTSTTGQVLGNTENTLNAATNTRLGNLTGANVETPVRAIHLSSEGMASQQNGVSSVFSTKRGDLHLDSGTRLQFRVAASSGKPDSKH